MRGIILLVSVLAVLLVVPTSAQHVSFAASRHQTAPALSGLGTRPDSATPGSSRPMRRAGSRPAHAPAAPPPTAEATNGLLGALLLTLSIITLYLLARRREVR